MSIESFEQIEAAMQTLVSNLNRGEEIALDELSSTPALRMAYETALLDLASEEAFRFFDCDFLKGKSIAINGLIWMGEKGFMLDQIKQKISSGFRCIKIKVAAIELEEEIKLIKYIREQFSEDDLQIRLDANGGFKNDACLETLQRLSQYGIHSIEQPIKQGQAERMAELITQSPIDIALDEELIGVKELSERRELLNTIKPDYIILKPSLVGGFEESDEWISISEESGIKWWATSALESNVGLNAIAQWCSTKENPMYQGLGTGQLFENNINSPLRIENAALEYSEDPWDISIFK